MQAEKGVEQCLVADLVGIEIHFDDLGVASAVGADVFVAGPVECAALIANSRGKDAGQCGKSRLNAPEASRPEGRFFCAHR